MEQFHAEGGAENAPMTDREIRTLMAYFDTDKSGDIDFDGESCWWELGRRRELTPGLPRRVYVRRQNRAGDQRRRRLFRIGCGLQRRGARDQTPGPGRGPGRSALHPQRQCGVGSEDAGQPRHAQDRGA